MPKELFYEIVNRTVLVYDLDGLSISSFSADKPETYAGEQQHLRYLTQAPLGEFKDLEGVLQQVISERMSRIPRRIKHRDRSTFDFSANPINRDYQPPELPIVTGQYANPHYQSAEGEKRV